MIHISPFQIRSQAMEDAKPGADRSNHGNTASTRSQHLVSSREAAAVRALIRGRQYLSPSNEQKEHKSLAGDVTLCEHLQYFTSMANSSMKTYMTAFLNKEPDDISVISLTDSEELERNNISKLKKDDIRKKIYLLFDQMDSPELLEEHFRKTISKKTHSAYVEFYYEVLAKSVSENSNYADCDGDTN